MTTGTAFETIINLLDNPDHGITTEEMRTLYVKIGEHTLQADLSEVIDTTIALVDAYAALGVTGIVAVEFGTEEWDNGYFFSTDDATLIGADENTIEPHEHPNESLFEAVGTALTQAVDASLGARSSATVNVAERTFDLNV